MFSCSKVYRDIPFSHRAPHHDGQCRFIHGHNWSFEFEFRSAKRDANGFVLDFGKLRWLSLYLERFDHALVLSHDDPKLSLFQQTLEPQLAKIVLVRDCSSEGLAEHLFDFANKVLEKDGADRGVICSAVTVREDSSNAARFEK